MNPTGLLDRIFHEVHRRRLLQVAGAYTIVCWFLVEIGAVALPILGAPEWAARALLAGVVLGLPVVLGIAWLVAGDEPAAGSSPSRRGWNAAVGVALVVLLALGAGARVFRARTEGFVRAPSGGAGAAAAPSPRTIAVLPLETMSPNRRDTYFSDGITVEIMNAVAKVPGLTLVARSSAFAFRGRAANLGAIRRQLGVGSVLEGSVRRAGDSLRIDLGLVDTGTGREIWRQSYDRRLTDIFALEDEIAQDVAGALQVKLTGPPMRAAATASVPAHDLYLLGLYHWNRRTGSEMRHAIDYFSRSAAADPSFARAYAGLASAYVLLPLYADVKGDDAYPRARAAAEQALALDSTLAEAHTALASVRMVYGWDWKGADAEFRRAIALDPSYATAHEWRAQLLDELGRPDSAAAEYRRARAADPMSVIIMVAAALHEALIGRPAAAAAGYRQALEREPGLPLALAFLAQAEVSAGRPDSALAAQRRWAAAVQVDPDEAEALVRGVDDASARPTALAALADTTLQRAFKAYQLATWAAMLGDSTAALTWLERSAANHDYLLFAVAEDPLLRPLHGSPRFRALLARMGLSPAH